MFALQGHELPENRTYVAEAAPSRSPAYILSDAALRKVLRLDRCGRLGSTTRVGEQHGHGAGGQP